MRKVVTAGGLLTVALCALGWFFLAPTSLGGRTTYVVTHGISMQPRFHTGDLAILHAQPSYHVGEVVAYRSATLKTVVMHRIVGRDGAGFVFKGDNNSWTDPDHPTQNDLLGALSMQVRGGGKYLTTLHSPVGLAVVGGLLSILLFGGGRYSHRKRARGRRQTQARSAGRHRAGAHRAPPTKPAGRAASAAPSLAGAALVLVAAFGGEAWLAHVNPQVSAQRSVSIQQSGTFGYHASVPRSIVYPSGSVVTGDPIFANVVKTLQLDFDYTTDATVSGKVALAIDVSNGAGWTGRLITGPSVPVTGGHAVASVDLDISAAQALLQQVAVVTGQDASGSLTVTPLVSVAGSTQGVRLTGGFAKSVGFTLGTQQLELANGSQLSTASPLTASVPGTAPRIWHIAGHRVGIRLAEIGVAAIALAALIWLLQIATSSKETVRAETNAKSAERRYTERLVEAESIEFDGPIVELTSMAALSSIAERYDRVILHTTDGSRNSYVVRDEVSWYRYQIRPERGHHARPAAAPSLRGFALARAS